MLTKIFSEGWHSGQIQRILFYQFRMIMNLVLRTTQDINTRFKNIVAATIIILTSWFKTIEADSFTNNDLKEVYPDDGECYKLWGDGDLH